MRTVRRRRLEGKTDYKARLSLLQSNKPRIVVRKSNRYILAQVVESNFAQDKVIVGVSSKDLLAHGWDKEQSGSLKNRAASYLTGFLLGKKAKEKKVSACILDIGLYRNIKKSRIYAFLKGLVDSGLEVPHSENVLPSEEQISLGGKFSKIIKETTK